MRAFEFVRATSADDARRLAREVAASCGALLEETVRDPRYGAAVTNNFADYRVPVCADIGRIDVEFVEEPDLAFNPLGARGIGEIGITGVAAAVANAVWHATGVRVRELPIVPERLLEGAPARSGISRQ